MQTTAQSIRAGLERAMLLLAERNLRERQRPRHVLLVGPDGKPVFRVGKDKNGDVYPIYRASPIPARIRSKYDGAALQAIRAEKGCGRPPQLREPKGVYAPIYSHALKQYGSQRAAARALGLNLSTFQRRLAKERCA